MPEPIKAKVTFQLLLSQLRFLPRPQVLNVNLWIKLVQRILRLELSLRLGPA